MQPPCRGPIDVTHVAGFTTATADPDDLRRAVTASPAYVRAGRRVAAGRGHRDSRPEVGRPLCRGGPQGLTARSAAPISIGGRKAEFRPATDVPDHGWTEGFKPRRRSSGRRHRQPEGVHHGRARESATKAPA